MASRSDVLSVSFRCASTAENTSVRSSSTCSTRQPSVPVTIRSTSISRRGTSTCTSTTDVLASPPAGSCASDAAGSTLTPLESHSEAIAALWSQEAARARAAHATAGAAAAPSFGDTRRARGRTLEVGSACGWPLSARAVAICSLRSTRSGSIVAIRSRPSSRSVCARAS